MLWILRELDPALLAQARSIILSKGVVSAEAQNPSPQIGPAAG